MTKLVDFLRSQQALDKFKGNLPFDPDEFFLHFGNVPTAFVRAFDWNHTPEGLSYWHNMDREFHIFLNSDQPSLQRWLVDNGYWETFYQELKKTGKDQSSFMDKYMFDPDAIFKAFPFHKTLFGAVFWTARSQEWGLVCTKD